MRSAGPCCWLLLGLLASALVPPAAAQRSLEERVEAYFAAPAEDQAQQELAALLDTEPEPAAVLAAVRRSAAVPGEKGGARLTGSFAFGGESIGYYVVLPEGWSREAPPPPVILDIAGGHHFDVLGMERCIRVGVERFDSVEFTDRRRDGYLVALRYVAHRHHGDIDRLWLTGYSWSAHACWDIAQHRPGVLRGFAAFGGGPRRVFFRLMPNLDGVLLRSYCGAKDDPELVWNLREMERVAQRHELDYVLQLDPEQGHNMPLAGYEGVAEIVDGAGPRPVTETGELRGELLADGPGVESPLLRFDAVDERRVQVPDRIPVSARLSPDEQRRATIAAMAKSVARIAWHWKRQDGEVQLRLRPQATRGLTVLLRAPWALPGDRVEIRVGSRIVHRAVLEPDPRTLLEEARRTGERVRPVLARVRWTL